MINLIFFGLRNANGSPSCYMSLKALSPTPLYYPLKMQKSKYRKKRGRPSVFMIYLRPITDYGTNKRRDQLYYTEINVSSPSGQQHRGMLQARRFKGHSTAAGTLCSSWRRSSMPLSLYANVPQTSTPSAQRVTQPWWGGRQGTPGKLRTSRVATPSIHAICS